MKQFVTLFLLFLATLSAGAQSTVKFGHLNADSLLRTLPDYLAAEQQMQQLRDKYEAEASYNERTFRRQYAEMIEGQQQFTPNILARRQADLQESLQKSLTFRQKADSLLQVTHEQLLRPVKKRLQAAIQAVGLERGYEYVVDTSTGAYPFIHPTVGEDCTAFVKHKLGLKHEE